MDSGACCVVVTNNSDKSEHLVPVSACDIWNYTAQDSGNSQNYLDSFLLQMQVSLELISNQQIQVSLFWFLDGNQKDLLSKSCRKFYSLPKLKRDILPLGASEGSYSLKTETKLVIV